MTGGANICAAVEFLIWIRILFVVLHTVTLLESVYTSAGINELLLAGEKRMAFGANLNVDIGFGRTCYESVSAVAGYSCLMVIRMDSFPHYFSPLLIIRELPALADSRSMPLRCFHDKIPRAIPASPYRYILTLAFKLYHSFSRYARDLSLL